MIDDQDIAHFIDLTQASESLARKYLTVSDGNVEAAISLFWDNGGADLGSETIQDSLSATDIDAFGSSGIDESSPFNIRSPIRPKAEVLYGNNSASVSEPWIDMSYQPSSAAGHSFPDPFDTASNDESALQIDESIDPQAAKLARLFKLPYDIMFSGNFNMARTKAEKEKKWVLVTIHDPNNFQCQIMVRDCWNRPEMKELIRENFVFILMGRESAMAAQYKVMYHGYQGDPFAAIIEPLTGEQTKFWSWSLAPMHDDFYGNLISFIDRATHPSQDTGASSRVAPKRKMSVNDLTEDEALQLALEESRVATASRNKYDAIRVDDDDGYNNDALDHSDVHEGTYVTKEDHEDNYGSPSPVAVDIDAFDQITPKIEPEPSAGDICRVQVRLPGGERLVRKFLKTDPVASLFAFVKSKLEGAQTKRFELYNLREPLLVKAAQSLKEANVCGASLQMEYL
ncbi:uncharacterized protein BJ171DRAFT_488164 [Polychytrium aggregatum]|uniref:uncharacterized protein n=1 Tax=Polychytrium aggregatum TaxID=110093 RepID=UPI0022FE7A7F|nr:uncharacterized protein BJ171DRAFT_488164 [Polychytrium aggregatum]KAI9209014.1 hypothetical protein BJ171DRAFT_488164 [Polychytrium aggregatum]